MAKKKEWFRSKTVWTGIGTIVGAIGGFLTGEVPLNATLSIGMSALMMIFLRTGIESTKK